MRDHEKRDFLGSRLPIPDVTQRFTHWKRKTVDHSVFPQLAILPMLPTDWELKHNRNI
jgi:hypothetical protein